MNRSATQEQGVSLIELLVAVAILAVGLTPLLSIFLHSLRASEKAHKMSIANNLARDMAEEIRSASFWEPDLMNDETEQEKYFPKKEDTAQPVEFEEAPFIVDSDKRIYKFDDVDDYDGWCRGKECTDCTDYPTGVCVDETYLETYDGQKYDGSGGYPDYTDFTRKVEVFNIFPHITSVVPEHTLEFKNFTSPKPFLFYNLSEDVFPTLTTRVENGTTVHATGRTRLKAVKVTVQYTGRVSSPVGVEDYSLVVLPISE